MSEIPIDDLYLPQDDAGKVADRLPNSTRYPPAPDRDNGLALDALTADGGTDIYIVPPYTAFVVHHTPGTYDDSDPVRLLLDAYGDNIIAWDVADNRYMAYEQKEFATLVDDGRIRLCRDIH